MTPTFTAAVSNHTQSLAPVDVPQSSPVTPNPPMVGVAKLPTSLVHPTAVIHPDADVHSSVKVGPYATIGAGVKIGAMTTIGAHAVIEGPTEIGIGNQIFPGAAIGLESQDLKYIGGETWLRIGNYNRIREYVTINRATGDGEATIIGNGNLLMAYVHIAHNCILENNIKIANSSALAGDVYVESDAVISGLIGVHQFVHIGRLAMVGGMSRVQRDVPPFTSIEGNPARVRSLNTVGLERANFSKEELQLLQQAFRTLYRQDLPLERALAELDRMEGSDSVKHLQSFLSASISGKPRRGPISGS
jgi:UDP-N-acetylglucosamine acyltransferase